MSQGILWVALGGALGAMARYAIGMASLNLSQQSEGSVFPWATLGINIAGSFAIGLLWSLYADTHWFQSWGRPLLVIGALGGFTTFSAFSLETLTLLNSHKWLAVTYVTSSVFGCLAAVAVGYGLGGLK